MSGTSSNSASSLSPDSAVCAEAAAMFNDVWTELVAEVAVSDMTFPKEIIWLNGAPGAGKGTNTDLIMKLRGLSSGPVVVSDLLSSPEAQAKKAAGILVGDREVMGLLFKELLKPSYISGTIVDGFPRSAVQVQCLKAFYEMLKAVKGESAPDGAFVLPEFHVVVLFVDEKESIRRQILRGTKAAEHNARVAASGQGALLEIRSTDMDAAMAQKRYRVFVEQTMAPLKDLDGYFPYHFVDAQGDIPTVQGRIDALLGA